MKTKTKLMSACVVVFAILAVVAYLCLTPPDGRINLDSKKDVTMDRLTTLSQYSLHRMICEESNSCEQDNDIFTMCADGTTDSRICKDGWGGKFSITNASKAALIMSYGSDGSPGSDDFGMIIVDEGRGNPPKVFLLKGMILESTYGR